MLERLPALASEIKERIRRVETKKELEDLRVELLGKKGSLTRLLRQISTVDQEERKRVGAALNRLKEEVQALLGERSSSLEKKENSRKVLEESLDITLPGIRPARGRRHVALRLKEEVEDAFLALGFDILEGPEVEWDSFNFEALNMPPEHPARDMWDTFYITSQMLLRTHTSPMQIRCMRSRNPPIRVIVPGLCYRHEAIDATHMDIFFQIEGLVVDRGVSFAELKGTLDLFARLIFGPERRSKFVPSYFPFTEPSAEMMISCGICGGGGCPSCGHSGWLEIMGCGQVHPQVLRNVGYDAEELTGFAFGLGTERIAMLKYNIPELRLFTENDFRFLEQF